MFWGVLPCGIPGDPWGHAQHKLLLSLLCQLTAHVPVTSIQIGGPANDPMCPRGPSPACAEFLQTLKAVIENPDQLVF